ncbi:thioredoxin-like protein [Tribonema minus]|uniref:Thioredoxin-like protein n=1 Tax=Tribonema minus TaxID=303371 RepID=A0A836CJB3_9STRA|nr:thioredoxin-like protein [Tribonema minus]
MSAVATATEQLGLVTVYHKETCPHCKKVLELLEGDYGLEVTKVDVLGEDSDKVLKQMRTFSGGRNTVPQVFFNSHHLGGNDDVQALHAEGELEKLVESILSEPATLKKGWYHPWY